MARRRKTALILHLTAADRQTLLAWQRVRTAISAGQARRDQAILLRASGGSITAIAATVGMTRRHVYKWMQRFVQEGLAGLADRPSHRLRRGPRPPNTQGQEAAGHA